MDPLTLILSLGSMFGGGLLNKRRADRQEGTGTNQLNLIDQFLQNPIFSAMMQMGVGPLQQAAQGVPSAAQQQALEQIQQLATGAGGQLPAFQQQLENLQQFSGNIQEGFGPLLQQQGGFIGDARNFVNQFGQIAPQTQQLRSDILGGQQQFREGLQPFIGDQFNRIQETVGNVLNRVPDILNLGSEVSNFGRGLIQDRGLTPEIQQLLQASQGLLNQTPENSQAIAQAMSIIQGGGRTPESTQLFNTLMPFAQSGGVTPEVTQQRQLGQNLLQQGGTTPLIEQIMAQLQQGAQGDPTAQQQDFIDRLNQILDAGGEGGGLLSMEDATSFARDQAATAIAGQAEGARRTAFQRGGAPGAFVGTGLQGQALAEFSDEAARLEAAALQQAAQQQQQLFLQREQGAQAGLGDVFRSLDALRASSLQAMPFLAQAEASNRGANIRGATDLLTNASQLQSSMFGNAVSGLGQTLATDVARLNAGVSLFDAANLDMARRFQAGISGLSAGVGAQTDLLGLGAQSMGAGADIMQGGLGTALQAGDLSRLGGQQAIDALMGMRGLDLSSAGLALDTFTPELEAGRLQLGGLGLGADISNDLFRNQLGAGQFGLDARNLGLNMLGGQQDAFGNVGRLLGLFANQGNTIREGQLGSAESLLQSGLGGFTNFFAPLLGTRNNMINTLMGLPGSGLGDILMNAGLGGLGGMINQGGGSGFGNIFGGIFGGGNNTNDPNIGFTPF